MFAVDTDVCTHLRLICMYAHTYISTYIPTEIKYLISTYLHITTYVPTSSLHTSSLLLYTPTSAVGIDVSRRLHIYIHTHFSKIRYLISTYDIDVCGYIYRYVGMFKIEGERERHTHKPELRARERDTHTNLVHQAIELRRIGDLDLGDPALVGRRAVD